MDNDDILLHLLKSSQAFSNSNIITEMRFEALEEALKKTQPKLYNAYRLILIQKMKEAFPNEYAAFLDQS